MFPDSYTLIRRTIATLDDIRHVRTKCLANALLGVQAISDLLTQCLKMLLTRLQHVDTLHHVSESIAGHSSLLLTLRGLHMQLSNPVIITSRLLPGVRLGGATISIDYSSRPGSESRTRYQWYVDLEGGLEFSDDDLQSGCQGGSLRDGLEALLGILAACGESYSYGQRTGRPGENADLFPRPIAEWAAQNSDELSLLAFEIEEAPDCIDESK